MADVYLPGEYTRRGNNRGFSNQRRAGNINPVGRLSVAGVQGRRGEGPLIPKQPKLKRSTSYGKRPKWWLYSEGEWIVYWYLKYIRKFVEDQDFYFQSRAKAPFLYAGKDYTQADFLLPYNSTSPLGNSNMYDALILDPITTFTHNLEDDTRRRNQLFEEGYLLVYINADDLEFDWQDTLEQALRGHDTTGRGV